MVGSANAFDTGLNWVLACFLRASYGALFFCGLIRKGL